MKLVIEIHTNIDVKDGFVVYIKKDGAPYFVKDGNKGYMTQVKNWIMREEDLERIASEIENNDNLLPLCDAADFEYLDSGKYLVYRCEREI